VLGGDELFFSPQPATARPSRSERRMFERRRWSSGSGATDRGSAPSSHRHNSAAGSPKLLADFGLVRPGMSVEQHQDRNCAGSVERRDAAQKKILEDLSTTARALIGIVRAARRVRRVWDRVSLLGVVDTLLAGWGGTPWSSTAFGKRSSLGARNPIGLKWPACKNPARLEYYNLNHLC